MTEPMQPMQPTASAMSAAELRERFQRFFEERGHTRVPSAPLQAKDDPTLVFINSGRAPFKRVPTGEEKRDYVRAVNALGGPATINIGVYQDGTASPATLK